MSEINNDIMYLNGVGPKKAELFKKELNINTISDLLLYFPYRYIDRTKYYYINEITPDLPYIQIRGKIIGFESQKSSKSNFLTAKFIDPTGSIDLVWFKGQKWILDSIKVGMEYIVFGKPNQFNNRFNIAHPEIELAAKHEKGLNFSLQALYHTSEKLKESYLNSKAIHTIVQTAVQKYFGKIPESLPDYMLQKLRLMPINDAVLNIHFPSGAEVLNKAQYRFKFEELFYIQLNILKVKFLRNFKNRGFIFYKEKDLFTSKLFHQLKFKLTGAQIRVLQEIRKDVTSGKQMNRLLQGDVGSGKTLVALLSMLMGVDNGYQACIMAPTEVLANQHYITLKEFVEGLNLNINILTGSSKKASRNIIHEELQNGKINILIGTHALLEDNVIFKNLGIIIIDEQHRFGVAQRAKLWQKNIEPPHVLVMTATPIPRTLAMTVYGDLDVSVIDELPPGRKPVQTLHYFDSSRLRVFGFIRKQIELGRQVYIVYPLIFESEKLDFKNLEDGIEAINREFPSPKYVTSIVHGRMKNEEKEVSMKRFVSGKSHIMIATTVIEVGINVPNASVMIIESAERFGLSQLHQLRGRVGRGAEQSYCILMTGNKLSDESRRRIETMVSTNDGFEIAETDLKLRGPGDIEGTQQSGMPFELKIADLVHDNQILTLARQIAEKILETDPELNKIENNILKQQLKKLSAERKSWAEIS
jgi:ATP-dependent DNA helicase RecG